MCLLIISIQVIRISKLLLINPNKVANGRVSDSPMTSHPFWLADTCHLWFFLPPRVITFSSTCLSCKDSFLYL